MATVSQHRASPVGDPRGAALATQRFSSNGQGTAQGNAVNRSRAEVKLLR